MTIQSSAQIGLCKFRQTACFASATPKFNRETCINCELESRSRAQVYSVLLTGVYNTAWLRPFSLALYKA